MLASTYYHGTTHAFRRFDLKKAYHDSVLGPAVYLSDCSYDASNYANEDCADLRNRIEFLADQLSNEMPYEKAKNKAKELLLGKNWRLLHVRPEVKNVAVMSCNPDSRETRIQLWSYDEDSEDGEFIETPEFTIIHDFLSRYLEQDEIIFNESETTFREIKDLLLMSDNIYDENESFGCMLAKLMQKLGYDAVLMLDTHEWFDFYRRLGIQSNHLVVFNPEQVKIVKRERLN